MQVTLWGTRGSLASPGAETARYGGNTSCVEVRARGRHRARPRRRHRHPPPRATRCPTGDAPRRSAAHPPPHGPHPGARVLRAALRRRHRGARLGAGEHDAGAAHAPEPLPLAAVLPRAPARPRLPADAARGAVRRFHASGRSASRSALVCHPGTDGRLSHRDRRTRRSPICPTTSRRSACARLPRQPGMDVGLRAGGGRRPAHPRRAVHRRGVRGARRLGPQLRSSTRCASPRSRVAHLVPFHHDPAHNDEDIDRIFAEAIAAVRSTFR